MRYEIKKILSCKILMISMIVAFIFQWQFHIMHMLMRK